MVISCSDQNVTYITFTIIVHRASYRFHQIIVCTKSPIHFHPTCCQMLQFKQVIITRMEKYIIQVEVLTQCAQYMLCCQFSNVQLCLQHSKINVLCSVIIPVLSMGFSNDRMSWSQYYLCVFSGVATNIGCGFGYLILLR